MDKKLRLNIERHIPVSELEFFLKRFTLDEETGHRNKENIIAEVGKVIAESPEVREALEKLLSQYKNAGRGSITWGIIYEGLSNEDIEKALINKHGRKVFDSEMRPEVTKVPALNMAEWMDEEKKTLRLEFAESGKRKLEYQAYELVEVHGMKIVDCFLRFFESHTVVEVRTNLNSAPKYHGKIGYMLNQKVEVIEFSLLEIAAIERSLNTSRKSAKHKKLSGDLDIVSVSASPTVEDLKASTEYNALLGNDEIKDARCQFIYTGSDGRETNVTLGISSKGSVWFLNEVPEEVVDHVFSVVKTAKGF
jgi:hypothetical protein